MTEDASANSIMNFACHFALANDSVVDEAVFDFINRQALRGCIIDRGAKAALQNSGARMDVVDMAKQALVDIYQLHRWHSF